MSWGSVRQAIERKCNKRGEKKFGWKRFIKIVFELVIYQSYFPEWMYVHRVVIIRLRNMEGGGFSMFGNQCGIVASIGRRWYVATWSVGGMHWMYVV